MFIPKRPWWKFWPIICWRHWVVVRKGYVCDGCLRENYHKLNRGPGRSRKPKLWSQ